MMPSMYVDFSGLFHQSSKDRSAQGRIHIPLDSSTYPAEWSVISYKEYPRMEQLALDTATRSDTVFGTIAARESRRDFARRPLSNTTMSTLLKYSCGLMPDNGRGYHRAQPSGGGRYPIEVYPVFFAASDIPAGVYHYNVKDHALECLWKRTFSTHDVAPFFSHPWAHEASCALFITGVFARNQIKYGERGYRQILVEVGAITQNVYLTATALNLSCCSIDGVYEPAIEKLLDIDGVNESMISSIVLG